MKRILKFVMVGMLFALMVWAQEEGGGGAPAGGPTYGPGTVPTVPGTDVPMPVPPTADEAGAASAGEAGAAPAEGEAGGGVSGEGGSYVERRQDKVVFETACLKCHPKEKILAKRRTDAQWDKIIIQQHLLQGKIFSSNAAPALRYLKENYGVRPPPAAPAPSPAVPAPQLSAPAPQPASTVAAPAPAPPTP